MNILITAIGSMSATSVIQTLKRDGHYVIGTDIYPTEWHYESTLCDHAYRVPLACEHQAYIQSLITICQVEKIQYIIPLTDIEIDILSAYRKTFTQEKITLCMQENSVLNIARNKYNLYQFCQNHPHMAIIPTYDCDHDDIEHLTLKQYPYIAKPRNGRSSEGIVQIHTPEDLKHLKNQQGYILQPYIQGNIYTVDYVRSASSKNDFSIPRKELLRTKNGAGLTVEMITHPELQLQVSEIGNKLQINGCVNMEFIEHGKKFYLIDINPRFSAGIAFSQKIGYDLVTSHLNCFIGKDILPPVSYNSQIITKHFQEIKL